MPSGYTSDLPDDILLDVAVLSRDVGGTPTVFGVSRGGLTFRPTIEYRNVEFDGKRSDIELLDRVIKRGGEISGTFIQLGLAQLNDLEPGSTVGTVTATDFNTYTITPAAASALLVAGDYTDNLMMTFQRGGGGTATVKFAKALCTQYEISGQDNSEAEVQATFATRLGATVAATSTDTAPYEIIRTEPVA